MALILRLILWIGSLRGVKDERVYYNQQGTNKSPAGRNTQATLSCRMDMDAI